MLDLSLAGLPPIDGALGWIAAAAVLIGGIAVAWRGMAVVATAIRGAAGSALAGAGVAALAVCAVAAGLAFLLDRMNPNEAMRAWGAALLLFGMRWLRGGAMALALADLPPEAPPGRAVTSAFGRAFLAARDATAELAFPAIALGGVTLAGPAGPALLPAVAAAVVAGLVGIALGVRGVFRDGVGAVLLMPAGAVLGATGAWFVAKATGLEWPAGSWTIPLTAIGFLLAGLIALGLSPRAPQAGAG